MLRSSFSSTSGIGGPKYTQLLNDDPVEFADSTIELRSRGGGSGGRSTRNFADDTGSVDSSSNNGDMVSIERDILPGDTLQKIALQYSVQVSELKRVNNLLSDQDFYALTSIRIPLSRYSSMLHVNQTASTSSSANQQHLLLAFDDDDDNRHSNDDDMIQPIEIGIGGDESPRRDYAKIIGKVDASLQLARERTNVDNEHTGGFHFIDATEPRSVTNYSPWLIVVLVIVLFVVLPLWFTIYEESESQQHVTSSTGSKD